MITRGGVDRVDIVHPTRRGPPRIDYEIFSLYQGKQFWLFCRSDGRGWTLSTLSTPLGVDRQSGLPRAETIMVHQPSADDLALEQRRPAHIMIQCDECHTDFYGELSRWWRVYTGGEDWEEICPNCRHEFWVTLRFKKRPKVETIPEGVVIIDGY